MSTPTGDEAVARLGWRVEALEKSHEHISSQLDDVRREIRDGFSSVKSDVKEMRLVTRELYDSEQSAQNAAIESVAKVAWWALAVVCTAVVAGLLGLLIRLASA